MKWVKIHSSNLSHGFIMASRSLCITNHLQGGHGQSQMRASLADCSRPVSSVLIQLVSCYLDVLLQLINVPSSVLVAY